MTANHSAIVEHKRDVTEIKSHGQGVYMFNCPHCDGLSIVEEQDLNCRIFRHGIYSQGPTAGQPINPHETEQNIARLVDLKLIDGCGKPIQMSNDNTYVKSCGYI